MSQLPYSCHLLSLSIFSAARHLPARYPGKCSRHGLPQSCTATTTHTQALSISRFWGGWCGGGTKTRIVTGLLNCSVPASFADHLEACLPLSGIEQKKRGPAQAGPFFWPIFFGPIFFGQKKNGFCKFFVRVVLVVLRRP